MLERYTDKILIILIVAIIGILAFREDKNRSAALLVSGEENELIESELTEAGPIMVHITGEVNRPDVYELSSDARLKDLVDKAGGFTSLALADEVNLAMRLEDEMHIRIPSEDDIENKESGDSDLPIADINQSSKLNINTATKEELMQLPGIGEKTAGKIIEHREKEKFTTIEDIKNVNGIGDKMFEELKEKIRVR